MRPWMTTPSVDSQGPRALLPAILVVRVEHKVVNDIHLLDAPYHVVLQCELQHAAVMDSLGSTSQWPLAPRSMPVLTTIRLLRTSTKLTYTG